VTLSAQQPNTLTQQEIDERLDPALGRPDRDRLGVARRRQLDVPRRRHRGVSGGYGWLGTTASFGDFHLKLEFKTAADGNSGVFLRSAREGLPHQTGYELQIYDDQPQGFNTGSLVFYQKAEPAKLKPDVWNSFDIICEGRTSRSCSTTKLVFDGYNATHAAGVIGLQFNPDKPIEYRNLKLRPMNLEPLLDGSTFAGWKAVDRPERPGEHTWTVPTACVHVEGGPGRSRPRSSSRTSMLQLAIKTNPPSPDKHPNSGVFIRGYPEKFWSGYEIQIRNEFFRRRPDPAGGHRHRRRLFLAADPAA
jgi:hypothetical protein